MMELLDVPGLEPRSRSHTLSMQVTKPHSVSQSSQQELPPMSRGPSIYRKRPGVQRYRSVAPADLSAQVRRKRLNRLISHQISEIADAAHDQETAAGGRSRRGSMMVNGFVPTVIIEPTDLPTVADAMADSLASIPNGVVANGTGPALVNCIIPLDELEKQWAWQDRELSKCGKFLDRLHCGLLPCCRADNESFGHHVSIFLVAILAFSTFICCTTILVLVFFL